jgi:OOP family OmpA-OmpF porin
MNKLSLHIPYLSHLKTYTFVLASLAFGDIAAQNTYEKNNLGPNINSAFSEINPIVSADGKTLYFIRSNHPENYQHSAGESQDIWMSEKDEKGQWKPAVHLGKEINRQQFNTLFSVNNDGNRFLIGGSYVNKVYWGLGFSFIDRKNGVWGEPKDMAIKKFEKYCRGFSTFANMVSDHQTLLLSFSEVEDSKANDLYISRLQKNGTWSEPFSLGDKINTIYDESTPFMAADGVTLYFSSDRPGGYGENDIYMTRRLDDTWKNWSEPVNLGPQINTEFWDGYYNIPASGDVAYMTSYKNTLGKADIVEIKLSKDKPTPVALLKGKILNAKTKQPVEAQLFYEILPSGDESGVTSFWSKSGDYKLVLPYGKNYGVSARAAGYIPVSIHVDLQQAGEYKELTEIFLFRN